MEPDRLLPGIVAGLLVGLVVLARLLVWRRRLPADFAGQVKADISLAMLRALAVVLAGLFLGLGLASGWLPGADAMRWLAVALVVIGGVGFLARAALYWLRIKPELDQISVPVPASPAVDILGDGEEGG